MQLVTNEIKATLLANAQATANSETGGEDFPPVVKFFAPWSSATWLISEMDEDGIMFGLCDLGMGCPELGSVLLQELESHVGPCGLTIERDRGFAGEAPMSVYADAARKNGCIVSYPVD